MPRAQTLVNTCGVITCSKCAYPFKECICAKAKDPAAVKLGRKGGRVRSEAKKASGKLNMEKARAAKEAKQMTYRAICPSRGCQRERENLGFHGGLSRVCRHCERCVRHCQCEAFEAATSVEDVQTERECAALNED